MKKKIDTHLVGIERFRQGLTNATRKAGLALKAFGKAASRINSERGGGKPI